MGSVKTADKTVPDFVALSDFGTEIDGNKKVQEERTIAFFYGKVWH